MAIGEVIRRWQAGESGRAIARSLGLSRNTVDKYLRLARSAGLETRGAAPTEAQLVALAQASRPGSSARERTPRGALLAPHHEQLARRLQRQRLQLTRVQELLGQQGAHIPYHSLRRYAQEQGLAAGPRSTVRVAETAPGEVAEFDFGRLGPVGRSGHWRSSHEPGC